MTRDDRPSTLVLALAFFAAACMVVLVAAGCGTLSRPASWWRDQVVECSGRAASKDEAALREAAMRALLSQDWQAAGLQLLKTGGPAVACVLTALANSPAPDTARLPAATVRGLSLAQQRAAALVTTQGLRVR